MADPAHQTDRFANQARCLTHLTPDDAWNRGVDADWPYMLKLMVQAIDGEGWYDAGLPAQAHYPYLDVAGASLRHGPHCFWPWADKPGPSPQRHGEKWREVYDESSGLLPEDEVYYEGTHWNYSFRFHSQMQERITS